MFDTSYKAFRRYCGLLRLRIFLRSQRSYLIGISSGLLLLFCAVALMQLLAEHNRKEKNIEQPQVIIWKKDVVASVERAGLEQRPARGKELGFDLARVNEDGQIMVGGYAPPLSRLVLLLDGEVLGAMLVDDRGEWLFLSQQIFKAGQYILRLETQIGEREIVYGIETLLVVIPKFSQGEERPMMAVLPNDGGEATRILSQRFSGDKTATGTDFIVDTIDYAEDGRLLLSGRLRGKEVEMLVYRNNKLVARRRYQGEGAVPTDWQISTNLPPSEKGLSGQVLRIDLVENNRVVQRKALPITWTPLVREGEDEYFVVSTGASLWHIARHIFGTGTLHTFLYEANKAQIENPDLIRPGQILFIPKKPSDKEQKQAQKSLENKELDKDKAKTKSQ